MRTLLNWIAMCIWGLAAIALIGGLIWVITLPRHAKPAATDPELIQMDHVAHAYMGLIIARLGGDTNEANLFSAQLCTNNMDDFSKWVNSRIEKPNATQPSK